MGGNSEDLIRQIYEARKLRANGVILFDYAHTTPVYMSTLMSSAFKSNEPETTKTKMAQKKSPKFGKKKKDKKSKKTKVKEKQ